jgi:formylglycine-generating enzyme required for sulfatase activity
VACTASGDAVESDVVFPIDNGGLPSSVSKSSSSKDSSKIDPSIFNLFDWVQIPKVSITRGVNSFGVNSFAIATTEVTQKIYKFVMNDLPQQSKEGDKRAVSNVNWFRAALFCNAISKLAGLDTAYVYKSISRDSVLVDLSIDYSVSSIRLPTENEWEIAARGGTSTTYYWDTDVASKYAYYGQTSGPDEVAQKSPNDFGLYDMAGNVAEWVNDWYDAYPKNKSDNYTGPKTGDYRIVRGGGWSDKVTALAPKEREKLDPAHSKATLGFRLVYSTGF